MLEYELRFRLEQDLVGRLVEKGFRMKTDMRMADLVFEPRDWKPGDMIIPGYHVVRIRLAHNHRPLVELKEFSHCNCWHELKIHTDDPAAFMRLFSRLMSPCRVIEKRREVWTNGTLDVCLDDVKGLGRFVEIEGPELYVKELAEELGFRPEDTQANYGSQMFYLEKMGFPMFNPDDMHSVLKEFGF